MTAKRAIALVPLLVVTGVVAGCGSGAGPAAADASPAASEPSPAAAGGSPAALIDNVLTCHSVVDSTGYKGGPLTTDLAIAILTEMQLTSGEASIHRGTPTKTVTDTLGTMSVELMGYSGSRLSDDAEAFAVAVENYNPDGPVDASYARQLDRDIVALQRDCPDGLRLGRQWRAAKPNG